VLLFIDSIGCCFADFVGHCFAPPELFLRLLKFVCAHACVLKHVQQLCRKEEEEEEEEQLAC
jgi:hypothetical protein